MVSQLLGLMSAEEEPKQKQFLRDVVSVVKYCRALVVKVNHLLLASQVVHAGDSNFLSDLLQNVFLKRALVAEPSHCLLKSFEIDPVELQIHLLVHQVSFHAAHRHCRLILIGQVVNSAPTANVSPI